MKSDGRDNTPDLVQIDTKEHASKARWVYPVPIQKNNKGVQNKKLTREYTNCFMLHRHGIFTSCVLGLQ